MLPTDLRPAHRAALAAAREQVGRVTTDDLARPTPCVGWDLGALLAHMIGQHLGFAAAVRDGDAPASAFAPVPWSPGAWADSVAGLEAAFATADLDAQVVQIELAPAPLPVSLLVAAHHLDTVVHTWDVARALGEGFAPPPDVVEIVTEVMALVPDDETRTRPGSPFGPATGGEGDDDGDGDDDDDGDGDDDGAWASALRHLGRTPGWAPGPR